MILPIAVLQILALSPQGAPQVAAGNPNTDTQWEKDLAEFDVELAKRKADFASRQISGDTKEGAKQILAHLCDLDQYMRKYFGVPFEHGYGGTPAGKKFADAFLIRSNRVDEANLIVFKALLARWGWFPQKEWGEEADLHGWLLVQHADNDLPFQKKVLAILEPLVKSGESDPSRFAYLYDRVAVNDRRLQRYGTQGFCTGPGKWTPRPIEDPEHVDEKRHAVGLPPMAEYIASFGDLCKEDETKKALKWLGLPLQKP